MDALEAKIQILNALMHQEMNIPEHLLEKVIENRKLNIINVDEAIQVQPIVLAKVVNFLYNELQKTKI